MLPCHFVRYQPRSIFLCFLSHFYGTDQMQRISLMCLSLATNAFIAGNESIYRWREVRLVIEKYTISDVYERV